MDHLSNSKVRVPGKNSKLILKPLTDIRIIDDYPFMPCNPATVLDPPTNKKRKEKHEENFRKVLKLAEDRAIQFRKRLTKSACIKMQVSAKEAEGEGGGEEELIKVWYKDDLNIARHRRRQKLLELILHFTTECLTFKSRQRARQFSVIMPAVLALPLPTDCSILDEDLDVPKALPTSEQLALINQACNISENFLKERTEKSFKAQKPLYGRLEQKGLWNSRVLGDPGDPSYYELKGKLTQYSIDEVITEAAILINIQYSEIAGPHRILSLKKLLFYVAIMYRKTVPLEGHIWELPACGNSDSNGLRFGMHDGRVNGRYKTGKSGESNVKSGKRWAIKRSNNDKIKYNVQRSSLFIRGAKKRQRHLTFSISNNCPQHDLIEKESTLSGEQRWLTKYYSLMIYSPHFLQDAKGKKENTIYLNWTNIKSRKMSCLNRQQLGIDSTYCKEHNCTSDGEKLSIIEFDNGILDPKECPMKILDPKECPMKILDPKECPMKILDPKECPMKILDPKECPMKILDPKECPMKILDPKECPMKILDPKECPIKRWNNAIRNAKFQNEKRGVHRFSVIYSAILYIVQYCWNNDFAFFELLIQLLLPVMIYNKLIILHQLRELITENATQARAASTDIKVTPSGVIEFYPRPRIPQIRVSNARLARAASGCAPSVDVLPIFDVKQQSVRNPARMGGQPSACLSRRRRKEHDHTTIHLVSFRSMKLIVYKGSNVIMEVELKVTEVVKDAVEGILVSQSAERPYDSTCVSFGNRCRNKMAETPPSMQRVGPLFVSNTHALHSCVKLILSSKGYLYRKVASFYEISSSPPMNRDERIEDKGKYKNMIV
ncbi:hypothetical protein WN51_07240 [Melipona quadrifasciata]|uniref:Uncharacterized protein n=1 Tax=Melipona quadrifasciata TaxID=166423 RepID=A0A0N0BJK0_9HYME|nr:hypothetical protein WN51_07240 [Melipona quadrifasciata]